MKINNKTEIKIVDDRVCLEYTESNNNVKLFFDKKVLGVLILFLQKSAKQLSPKIKFNYDSMTVMKLTEIEEWKSMIVTEL